MRTGLEIGAAALASLAGMPETALTTTEPMVAQYESPVAVNAANIRGLSIMLMVTSLRCRSTRHDFRADYDLFSRTHRQNLSEARRHLKRDLAAIYGEDASARALDRIGVSMANRYGDGHPTLGCAELKLATRQLAMNQDRQRLSMMADRLMAAGIAGGDGKPAMPRAPFVAFDPQAVQGTSVTVTMPAPSREAEAP